MSMISLTRNAIAEDISLLKPSSSLWRIGDNTPEIRQIFGHFLPPYHFKVTDGSSGLVAKDFNFPPPRDICSDSLEIQEMYDLGERLTLDTCVSLDPSVKIRGEEGGAVIYASYGNGFFANRIGREILHRCQEGSSLRVIASESGCDPEIVTQFVARTVTLGIVSVLSA
jgi:hypothetical protein